MDHPLTDRTVVVTGASRGFGRAVAAELVAAGARVVGVARDGAALEEVAADLGAAFVPVAADAAAEGVAEDLLAAHRPTDVVLAAGVFGDPAPLHQQTWDGFSQSWMVDAQQAFRWCRAALLAPLPSGSTVVAFSSGAALAGSPLSGGYAAAKAAVRFVASYAAEESARAGLGIRFTAVLPGLTPHTGPGARWVAAYAERAGVPVDDFVARMGPVTEPERLGRDVRDLLADASYAAPAYRITPTGGLHALG